ncbi:MAG: HPr family phosphocarrier protein [Acidobacteriota bacterium]|nr:MAG: HPr family phosphocarrier protein [Acidobacteriota bacterium]
MTTRTITIVNRLGLHARAAARFVELAGTFRSRISIRRGELTVDGKSILGVLTLAAARGSVLELCAEGPDEAEAVDALARLVAGRFGEET